jgi:glycine cleavage system H protein
MNLEQLKYNPSHEWAQVTEQNGERIATIGITAFALEQLTDLVYMALPAVGSSVTAGEEFGQVESVKAVSPLNSPVSGTVVAVHSELVDQLDTLASDPYDRGWLVKFKLADDASLDHLLDLEQYQQQCQE